MIANNSTTDTESVRITGENLKSFARNGLKNYIVADGSRSFCKKRSSLLSLGLYMG
jgi:hypothetical protein